MLHNVLVGKFALNLKDFKSGRGFPRPCIRLYR
nr:MAG TPA: hypothetical protein [Caudoviricetes sp.]